MLLYTYFNIKTFSNTIFIVYHITAIIMELFLPSIVEIYITFQDLHVAMNLYTQKKVILLLQNNLRKIRKKSYKRYRYNVIKVVYLRP